MGRRWITNNVIIFVKYEVYSAFKKSFALGSSEHATDNAKNERGERHCHIMSLFWTIWNVGNIRGDEKCLALTLFKEGF